MRNVRHIPASAGDASFKSVMSELSIERAESEHEQSECCDWRDPDILCGIDVHPSRGSLHLHIMARGCRPSSHYNTRACVSNFPSTINAFLDFTIINLRDVKQKVKNST